jgi:Tol biopolymer transport system component
MGTKKIFFKVLLSAFILAIVFSGQKAGSQQSAEELYEAAVFKKDVDGDLKGAIKLFEKILTEFPDRRAIAAKAQLQIGICSEKLGLEEARKAYQKVIDQYPDQAEVVRIAKQKLNLLNAAIASPQEKMKELTIKKVDIPNGTLSFDGNYVSYIDWSTGDLALHEIVSGKKQILTQAPKDFSEFALDSVWSADSKRIAYSWINKDEFWDLRLIDKEGSNSKTVFSKTDMNVVSIAGRSTKGEIIFLVSQKDRAKLIGSVSINNGEFREIKDVGKTYVGRMEISPDGRFLAYDFQHDENFKNSDIHVISIDGKQEFSVVKHPACDLLIGWTPDGDSIVFSSDRTGNTGIWITAFVNERSENKPTLVKDNIGLIHPIGISKDGKFYYWVSKLGRDVYTSEIELTTGKILIPSERVDNLFQGRTSTPFWSPDGKFLAYFIRKSSSNRPFNYDTLRIRTLKPRKEREISLGFDASIFTQLPRWSPDGKFIYLTGQDKKKKGGFFKLSVQTGESELILDRQVQAWSSDGNIIYEIVTNWDEKLSRRKNDIVMTNLRTGEEKKIYQSQEPGMMLGLSLSPNEKWLGFRKVYLSMKPIITTLNVMPAQGGEILELFRYSGESISTGSRFFWDPSSQGILFVKRYYVEDDEEEKESELWYVPSIHNPNPRKLELEMYGIGALSFHPDGKRIAFESGKIPEDEIWIMENFMKRVKEK